jgi:ATP-binding cassette subfamily B protein
MAVQENFSALSDFVQESISGVRIIKSFVRERSQADQLAALSLEQKRRNLSLVKIWSLFLPFISFAAGLSLVVLLWMGGRQVMAGDLSLGELVAFSGYLTLLVWPLTALGWVINLLQRGTASLARIGELLDEQPEIVCPASDAVGMVGEATIRFENVSFTYPGSSAPALSGITMEIRKGETVALVGSTGSGKSTIANLLPRVFDPSQGRVLLDGKDLRSYDLTALRRNIGYVPQESFLFSDTIQENVGFGLPAPDEQTIAGAAEVAQLLPDIESMPKGWNTWIGERGVTLSGGQRQRASLARALAIDPPILVLDDAFSSVDLKTESKILQRLSISKIGKTTLIITHRISVAAGADRILVLSHGRIIDEGIHSELLERCELYQELHEKQLLQEELKEV